MHHILEDLINAALRHTKLKEDPEKTYHDKRPRRAHNRQIREPVGGSRERVE